MVLFHSCTFYFLCILNINQFAKNEKELETLIETIRIFSQDVGMGFGMIIMWSRKRQITEGIELSNQERIRRFRERENYKFLAILKADTIKQAKMKEKK